MLHSSENILSLNDFGRKMIMNRDLSWYFCDGIRFACFGHSALILDISASKYFSLNGLGAQVCRGIQENQGTAEIVDRIALQYENAGYTSIRHDVEAFLGQLRGLRICREAA